MDVALTACIVLVVVYRLSETIIMARTGTLMRQPKRDWTAYLIMVPYWLVVAVPAIVYAIGDGRSPATGLLVVGTLFFAGATAVRVKAHFDLGGRSTCASTSRDMRPIAKRCGTLCPTSTDGSEAQGHRTGACVKPAPGIDLRTASTCQQDM